MTTSTEPAARYHQSACPSRYAPPLGQGYVARRVCTPGSAVPADDDPPLDGGQRQRLRFRHDRIAFCARQPPPGLHRHHRVRAPPRPGDLSPDEKGAGPDAGGPQRATLAGVRDQEIAIGSIEEEIGITAREQARGRGGTWGGAEGSLVLAEDPRIADRCLHRCDRRAKRLERRA